MKLEPGMIIVTHEDAEAWRVVSVSPLVLRRVRDGKIWSAEDE